MAYAIDQARSTCGIRVPGPQRAKQRNDGEVTRLHDRPRLDLPHRRHGYLGAGRELLLGQARLGAKIAQQSGQAFSLVGVRTVCAPPAPWPAHPASIEIKNYR